MVAIPAEAPVTEPVLPTVAMEVLDDDHEPPAVTSENVTDAPVHVLVAPVMAATGNVVFTVTLIG